MGSTRGWRLALVALIALAALAVAGISVVRTSAFEEAPADGGAYSEAVVGRFRWLNPILAESASPDRDIVALAFAGLTRRLPSGQVVPDLARDWEIGPDALSYTFRLREDAVWQDGAPVTTEDVAYTYAAIQDADFAGPVGLHQYWLGIKVAAVDARQVRFDLRAPDSRFLEQVSLGLLPAHLLKGVSAKALPENRYNALPVGAGPFRVVSATADRVILEANPSYRGGHPYFSRVELTAYADSATAVAAFGRDEVDAVSGLSAEQASALAEAKAVQAFPVVETARPTVLLLNVKDPLFADGQVRQALAFAVDRDRVAAAALGGAGSPATGIVPSAAWEFDPTAPAFGYDPARASALLDAAGWARPADTANRQRDGKPLAFVLLTNDAPEQVRAAQEISRELAQIGARADVQAAGWTGVVQDFLVPHQFQAALTTLWSPNAEPDLYAFWHSSQAKDGLNFGGYSDPASDRFFERLRAEPRPDARRAIWAEAQRWFVDAVPAVPLYYPSSSSVVSRRIHGVTIGLTAEPSDRFASVFDWYTRTRLVPRKQ